MLVTEVLDFIYRRWDNINENWTNGNCYWFAFILCERFKELKIYYLPVCGHFVAGNSKYLFDYTGIVETSETPVLLEDIKSSDSLWYNRLIEDCKM